MLKKILVTKRLLPHIYHGKWDGQAGGQINKNYPEVRNRKQNDLTFEAVL